jgi:flagellar protein FliL
MSDNPKETTGAEMPQTAQAGLQSWLPLVLTVVLMPALAYVMTTYVLVPKLQKSAGTPTVEAREPASTPKGGSTGGAEAVRGGTHSAVSASKNAAAGKPRTKVPLSKIVVNVSGSMGTRLLLVNVTLAGSTSDFKQRVEDETDALRDLAASTLSAKTMTDLEKPEARNLIRAELLSQFNTVLGNGVIQDIYITEFAMQ